jgi:hypothetical protein
MTSAWTGKPCPCGRKKSPSRKDLKFCTTCERARKKAASKAAHGKRVEANFGITEEDYWELYEFQGGRCYICRWAQGKSKRLCVDHDHSCTAGHDPKMGCPLCVRGLLCKFCNTLIGRARDSIDFFRRCIEYLTDPPWQRLQRLRRK